MGQSYYYQLGFSTDIPDMWCEVYNELFFILNREPSEEELLEAWEFYCAKILERDDDV